MQITAPRGYGEIVPLQKTDRVLMPAGNTPIFCRTLNALAVSMAEFVAAGRDYPIVFATGDAGASFSPVIVLGFTDGTNLFVDAAGEWDRGAYFPAYVRRFPFCLSKVYVDGEPRGDRVVCVAKSYLDPGGIALFDAAGRPTPRWTATERLLGEFEADLDRTAGLCAALARLALLEPFSMRVNALPQISLGGMFRVSEEKLRALSPASHSALVKKGFMGAVYAHLHSLASFERLAARTLAAQPRATPGRAAGKG